MNLPREINDKDRNYQPEQAFDEKKHKAPETEAFEQINGGTFTF